MANIFNIFKKPWHELNQVVVCQLSEHLGGSQIRSFNLVFIMLEQFVTYFQNINVKNLENLETASKDSFSTTISKTTLARFVRVSCPASKSHLEFYILASIFYDFLSLWLVSI